MESKGRCRRSLKGKLKSPADVLHGTSVLVRRSVQSSAASRNVCLPEAETEAANAGAPFFFLLPEESR